MLSVLLPQSQSVSEYSTDDVHNNSGAKTAAGHAKEAIAKGLLIDGRLLRATVGSPPIPLLLLWPR